MRCETVDGRSNQKVCSFDPFYYNAWLTYIKMCQNQQDLFDFAQEYGIGNFEASFVQEMANFYTYGGDYSEGLAPTIDYRKTDQIYHESIANISELISTLEKLLESDTIMLQNEEFITQAHLHIYRDICSGLISHYEQQKITI